VKDKIVEQSILFFEKKGFSETSIQDIVDALGVTKGTFYYYFSSKEQLLMDIHLRYLQELLNLQQQIIDDQSKDCKTKLLNCVQVLIKQVKSNGQEARVYFREMRNLQEENLFEIKKMRDQVRFHFQKVIEMGMKSGEFRDDLLPDMVALGILGMCNWSYFWFDPNSTVTEDELIQTYIEIALHGIGAKK
jgi:TetR/AcrR family transcriptional regulator, cholesterol catabolism regulator